ncbi:ATPase [Vibrio phage River4]|uniref:Uncharacterized protein n=1 Tax=Vibrio phage River4 TaxID=2736288 RepID=A0A6M9Z137_9CAUD|nr:ATPase [Vibrio phage River4]QKN84811.1 hypothetical protein RIVER4_172 [Vibrio phage River4]
MKKLYLIRGVSGSGKTTLAEEMYNAFRAANIRASVVAADDYFYKDRETYQFNVSELGEAHAWCQEFVADGMRYDEYEAIIVHNTFTTEKEMRPYLQLAEMYDYDVTSLVVEHRHDNKSVHDVPTATLVRQSKRLRDNLQLI